MNRRDFLINGALGSASFAFNMNLHRAEESHAIFMFLLRLASGPLGRAVISSAIRGLAGSVLEEQRQQWYDSRRDAQLAQQELVRRQFTDIFAANVNSPQYSHVLTGMKFDDVGYTPAVCFTQNTRGNPNVTAFSGPAAIGMAYAAQYLADKTQLSAAQIQDAVLPKRGHGSNWQSWSQDYAYTKYETTASQVGVTIEYRSRNPRPGGSGEVIVHLDAGHQFHFGIEVQFAG